MPTEAEVVEVAAEAEVVEVAVEVGEAEVAVVAEEVAEALVSRTNLGAPPLNSALTTPKKARQTLSFFPTTYQLHSASIGSTLAVSANTIMACAPACISGTTPS